MSRKSGEAQPLIRRALAIDEASFGDNHPNVAIPLNNLALLLKATNRLADAEPLAEGARLFHQRNERAFGGRVRGARREKAVNFVEDDECSKMLAAGEPAHPREHFFEQHAEHERAFVVVKVRDAHDDGRRATLPRREPTGNVERDPVSPRCEGR